MNTISLQNTTGNQRVDNILCGLITIYETLFPERIRGYYLMGSYTDASAGAISDIDMSIIFKNHFVDESEENKAHHILDACALLSPIRLDILVVSEEGLKPEDIRLKTASVCIYGEDIRDNIPLPTRESYTRYITGWPFYFLARVLRNVEVLHFPVQYPQPDAEFYGYTQKRVPAWYPPSIQSGTKELVASVCWTATALLTLKTGHHAGKKAAAIKTYSQLIGDEWTGFIQDIYGKCSQQWGYRIPHDSSDRALLEDLCRRMLAFENHYLRIYRAYLLEQLREKERDTILFAAKGLKEVIYPDQEIVDALRAIERSDDDELQQAVIEALQSIERKQAEG